MKHLFAILLLIVVVSAHASTKLRVFDSNDNTPLASAVVFSNDGRIIGLTDKSGEIEIENGADYPVRIKYIGYFTLECQKDMNEAAMMPKPVELKEVMVTPEDL